MGQTERDFQRQWKLMQQLLGSEARGEAPHAINSTRTLFGIKSSVEQMMDDVAAEDLARAKARIAAEKAAREGAQGASDDNERMSR